MLSGELLVMEMYMFTILYDGVVAHEVGRIARELCNLELPTTDTDVCMPGFDVTWHEPGFWRAFSHSVPQSTR